MFLVYPAFGYAEAFGVFEDCQTKRSRRIDVEDGGVSAESVDGEIVG